MQATAANKVSILKEASQLFAQGKEKDAGIYKTLTDEQLELLELQINMEKRCDTKRVFLDLSLTRTLYELVLLGTETLII
jgi:hypothetical protein